MSDKELLLCPFCNGKAILKHSGFGLILCAVSCERCGARITGLIQSDVIDAWNRRVDVANTYECCEKSCKEENSTCKKSLQVSHCKKGMEE